MSTTAEPISTADAEQLVARARSAATDIGEQIDALMALIQEIRDREVAKVLGYKSWPALLIHIFEGSPFRVDADNRRRLVNILVNVEGLSSRVVAPIVGASSSTVLRDAAEAATSSESTAPTASDDAVEESDTPSTESDTSDATVTPIDKARSKAKPTTTKRTGLDGRTRAKPKPKPVPTTPELPADTDTDLLAQIRAFSKMLDTTTDFTDEVRAALLEVQEKLSAALVISDTKPEPESESDYEPVTVVEQIDVEPLIMIPRVISQQALADGHSADDSWIARANLRRMVTRPRKIKVGAFDKALEKLIKRGVVIAADRDGIESVRVAAHHSDDRPDATPTPIKLLSIDAKLWPTIVHYSGRPELLTELMRVRSSSAPKLVELMDNLVIEYRLLTVHGDTWKLTTNADRVADFYGKSLPSVRAM